VSLAAGGVAVLILAVCATVFVWAGWHWGHREGVRATVADHRACRAEAQARQALVVAAEDYAEDLERENVWLRLQAHGLRRQVEASGGAPVFTAEDTPEPVPLRRRQVG
jgi:hypothetical protein